MCVCVCVCVCVRMCVCVRVCVCVCLQEVFQDNYGYRQIRRWWLEGKFSIVKSLDDLPQRILCPMDVDTWGEILEHELKR